MSDDKVLPFRPVVHSSGHEPPLSDQELVRIREMLRQFDRIKVVCPLAARAVEGMQGKRNV